MERLYAYDGARAIIGLAVVVKAAVAGENTVLTALFGAAGGAMVGGAGYDALRRDPAEFSAPAGAVFSMWLAAAVALLGALLLLAFAA